MSRNCPFSCRTEGIDKRHCRDWKEGNRCFVEDLSRAPNQTGSGSPAQNPGYQPWGSNSGNHRPEDPYGSQECRSGGYIARPRISIFKSRHSGNFFGSKLKVRGEIEGVCIAEAGYFEAGRKRANIPVVTTRDFRRFEFEINADSSEIPEIRAYNSNGDMDSVSIN